MNNKTMFYINIVLVFLWIGVGILCMIYGVNKVSYGCIWLTLIIKYINEIIMQGLKKE